MVQSCPGGNQAILVVPPPKHCPPRGCEAAACSGPQRPKRERKSVASETTRWRNTGVFFDNVAIRFADGDGEVPEGFFLDDQYGEGFAAPAAYKGSEEFTFAAPIPGAFGGGAYDGKAEIVVVYRLSLDAAGHLN
jgi:hypothetical protein